MIKTQAVMFASLTGVLDLTPGSQFQLPPSANQGGNNVGLSGWVPGPIRDCISTAQSWPFQAL